MKLKEYLESLNKIAQENPEALDYDVVCSKDEEGNSFYVVNCEPSLGCYDKVYKEFYDTLYDENDNEIEIEEYNSICIN